ncbi:glycosyltransferase family 4 protein [Oleidesulfovibrio sp.]|uniref:glycosyltransferase family 4 protein n=1 Tax=Oleidesulfovibrio sp. TaxID=2909707 RepID=UPI003A863F7A
MQLFVQTLASLSCDPQHKGFKPAVWSMHDGERGDILRQNGIPVYIGPDISLAAAAHRPAIIHVHRAGWPEPDLMRPVQAIRKRSGTGKPAPFLPIVVETNVFGRLDDSPSGREVDSTLFVSSFCAARYQHLYSIPVTTPRRMVLYNPVDTDFLEQHTTTPEQRDFSRPVIGRLSRADSGKWSPLALSFLPALVKKFPHLEYRVVGGIAEARNFVAKHRLQNNVRFLPPLRTENELAEFLDGLSILAHANDTGESFGLAIAEAMSCGLPVITHQCHDWRDNAQTELVDQNITGLIADSADEYAAAVHYLLSHPEEARRMGIAGRNKARACFKKEYVTRQLAALYHTLLGIPDTASRTMGNPHACFTRTNDAC